MNVGMMQTTIAPAAPLKLGQRFRRANLWLLGCRGAEWVVRDLFVGPDDHWHARIDRVSGPRQSKTLPVAALTGRGRFTPS